MSPFTDPMSPLYINPHARDVTKRSPNTPGDFLLTWVILGIFGTIIILNLLIM